MPSASLRPSNWIRDDVIFFFQHVPFPAYLKRFHLSDSDYCSCGAIGTTLQHLKSHSVLAYEEANAKLRTRMAEKSRLVSRHKIRRIVTFISENSDLFRPP
ncbi:hypothetical protein AVEN_68939-1 [Araneus ventricosus]|uniref:Uncharacterized protein n=1 Tax=Araneus ventricosus TaxID=182803 RepID=A0A4Y2HJ16_ARAVE|nr:hypothetical protein AVEN_68939-1 [Araneus ventricosus]